MLSKKPQGCALSTNLIPPVRAAEFSLDATGAGIATLGMAVSPPNSGKPGRLDSLRAACAAISIGRRKAATVAAAVLALGVGYHVIFGANGLTVYEQKRQENHLLSLQMQDLQRENELLKGHVDRLQSDPNAIEHQAREELHYTRPGEVIYTLPGK
jgi:cell division protein FtsB